MRGPVVFAVLNDVLWADPAPPLSELGFVAEVLLARVDVPTD